jgi:hypothetical protein
MSDYIVLLDPSLRNNKGVPSFNLGDIIIYESVKTILHELFPAMEVRRISTHVEFDKNEIETIKQSAFCFVGGTNLLSSDIRHFARLTPVKKKFFYLAPGFNNIILIGAGWDSYDAPPDLCSRIYYRNILSKQYKHSLRENYAIRYLKKSFFSNLLHTSCPTTWQLNTAFNNVFDPARENILFTLTDYNRDVQQDTLLIEQLLGQSSNKLIFFPQGHEDAEYLTSLKIYKDNQPKFALLQYDYNEFEQFVRSEKFNYVGTRLHAGIMSLRYNHPSLIIGIDNRALEMEKDTGLNVVDRNDADKISRWLKGYKPPLLHLPLQNIAGWKEQFRH